MSTIAKVARIAVAALIAGALFVLPSHSPCASAGPHPSPIIESVDGRVSIDAREIEISELLRALSEKTGADIVIDNKISGKITIKLSAATLEEALRTICQNSAIEYEYKPDTDSWRVLRRFAFAGSNADSLKSVAANKKDARKAVPRQPEHTVTAGDIATPAGGTTAPTSTAAGSDQEKRPSYKKGELLVKFRQEATPEEIAALHARLGSVVLKTIPSFRIQRVKLKTGLDEGEAIRAYQEAAIVEHAERHALRYPQTIPNDTSYSSQWGMKKIGMENLWDITTGNRDVIVAVIDSGVDYTHPDLQGNIWVNETEKNGTSSEDDDGNGYVDDIYGWDFAGATEEEGKKGGDNNPMDSYGHGTHVAGIIGAVGNNGIGVTGVNWKIRIMPLKVMQDRDNAFTDAAILEAIAYAIDNGADVVNCSFGGDQESTDEIEAFTRLRDNGIIAACSAGNYSHNMDMGNKIYPACYTLDNIISVANSSSSDTLATSSNYGEATVDVAAPGESIYSTKPSTSATTASVKTPNIVTPYQAAALEFSGITSDTGLTRILVYCGMGYTDQIPDAVSGNIALIERGNRDGLPFYFSDKVLNAQAKGAEGVIIYNNADGTYDGTLGSPGNWPPVVSVSRAIGVEILEGMENGMLQNVTLTNKPSTIAYGYMSGTSMAAPHVAGLAGMILGQCPSLGYADVRAAIINTSDKITALADKTASGGRINAFAALTSLFPPGDLSADCRIGLEDAIIGLRIMTKMDTTLPCPLTTAACRLDTNGDGVIDSAEIIYILQKIAEVR